MVDKGDIERIRELLGQHKQGLTIDEVARYLGINRSTASKYLNSLVFSGAATIRRLGPAKLFYLREVVPLDQLLDHASDGFIVIDSAYVVHYLNRTVCHVFGCQPDDVIGLHVHDTPLYPLFSPETFHAIENVADGDRTQISESQRIGGVEWTVEKWIFPLHFKSGLMGIGIVCRFASPAGGPGAGEGDREETVPPLTLKSYLQQTQLNTLLRRYAKNQVSLALDIARKMKLTRVNGIVSDLAREQEETLQSLFLNIRSFDDFLGDEPLKPGWYSLDETVRDALSSVKLAGIHFFSDGTGYLVCSTQGFPLVLRALLENSVVHGGKVTSIRFTAREIGGGLVITYEDDGVGIPETEKQQIFEWGRGPHRAHSLFLARQVLSVTGISIKETGRPGRGARFEILVPPGRFRPASE